MKDAFCNHKNRKMRISLIVLICALGTTLASGQNKQNFHEDREMFLTTLRLFGEANQLCFEIVEELNDGNIPDASPFLGKIKEGILASEKVSDLFLDSKHPKLKTLFRNYVESYKLTLRAYNQISTLNEIEKLQSTIDEKQDVFFHFLEENQSLFNGEIRINQSTSNSRGSVGDYLLMFGKIFLVVFPFSLVLGIVSSVISITAFLVNKLQRRTKDLILVFLVSAGVLYLYAFAFLGAYFYETYAYYSDMMSKNWALYLICLLGILLVHKSFSKELRRARSKLNDMHPSGAHTLKLGDSYSTEELELLTTIYTTRGFWIVAVSFMLFSFYPDLVELFYGHIPNYFATLWT